MKRPHINLTPAHGGHRGGPGGDGNGMGHGVLATIACCIQTVVVLVLIALKAI